MCTTPVVLASKMVRAAPLLVRVSVGLKETFCVQDGSAENTTGSSSTGCPCASRTRTTTVLVCGKFRMEPPRKMSVSETCKDTLYPCSDSASGALGSGAQAVLTHSNIEQKPRVET